jgi:MarR family
VSDLLDRIHREIRERMTASRAAAREYERLQAALTALTGPGSRAAPGETRPGKPGASAGGSRGAAAVKHPSGGAGASGRAVAASGERAPTRRGGGRGRSGAKASARAARRAPRGANREAVLRVVADRPGVSSGELADATGVKRTTLSTLLATLTKRGELERREMPGGQRGYALAASADAGNEANGATEASESAPDTNGQAPPDQRGDLAADPSAHAADEPPADESSANQQAAGVTTQPESDSTQDRKASA